MAKNVGFQSFFDGIRELHAACEKSLTHCHKTDLRSRDDNAGLKIALPDEASDARSGNHTGEGNGRAGLREAAARSAAMRGPDSRVSMPMRTWGLGFSRCR